MNKGDRQLPIAPEIECERGWAFENLPFRY